MVGCWNSHYSDLLRILVCLLVLTLVLSLGTHIVGTQIVGTHIAADAQARGIYLACMVMYGQTLCNTIKASQFGCSTSLSPSDSAQT